MGSLPQISYCCLIVECGPWLIPTVTAVNFVCIRLGALRMPDAWCPTLRQLSCRIYLKLIIGMQDNLLCHTVAALATNLKLPAGPNQTRGKEAFSFCGCWFDKAQLKIELGIWWFLTYSDGKCFRNKTDIQYFNMNNTKRNSSTPSCLRTHR